MLKKLSFAGCLLPIALLAGCNASNSPDNGGGSDLKLTADRASYQVGDVATLTPHFSGTVARIDPGIGSVRNGVAIKTPPLSDSIEYKLVVGSGSDAKSASLNLPVSFRNSYRVLDQSFAVSQHAALTLGDGSVLVSGGSRGLSTLSNAINRFYGGAQGWTQVGTLSNGRSEHLMTLLAMTRCWSPAAT